MDDSLPGEVAATRTASVRDFALEANRVSGRDRMRAGRWRTRLDEPSWVYLFVAIPFGLLFVILIPPSQVLDEAAHWYRVWEITDGRVIAEVSTMPESGLEVNYGDYPPCVRSYTERFMEVAASPEPFDPSEFWSAGRSCDGPDREVPGEAMGPYSLWTYPGQAVGVAVGRVLQLPIPIVFYLGRFCGLAVATALCWFGIRQAPRAQNLLCFVSLLPMSLMSNAGYSPDGVVLGTCVILTGYALRFALSSAIATRRDLWVVGASLVALGATKPPYLLFASLFLLYRPDSMPGRWSVKRFGAAVTALSFAAAGTWSLIGYPRGAVEVYRPGIDPGGQVAWILANPLSYLNVLVDTFMSPESQDFVLRGWVGAFGMFRIGVPDSPLMSMPFVYLATAVAGALTVAEAGRRRDSAGSDIVVARWLLPFALAGAMVLALYTSAYVAWDRVGAERIFGVQGRYFIPLLPLAGVGLALRHERSDAAVRPLFVGCVASALGVASVVKMSDYFY